MCLRRANRIVLHGVAARTPPGAYLQTQAAASAHRRRSCVQVLRQYSGLGRTTAKIPDHTGVIVCTIEKANALVNFMTAEGTLAQSISTVIVDELHMVDDADRGYLL